MIILTHTIITSKIITLQIFHYNTGQVVNHRSEINQKTPVTVEDDK